MVLGITFCAGGCLRGSAQGSQGLGFAGRRAIWWAAFGPVLVVPEDVQGVCALPARLSPVREQRCGGAHPLDGALEEQP